MKRLLVCIALLCMFSCGQKAPLKLWPEVDPRMSVTLVEQRDGYTCSLIEYNAVGEERLQAYLLVPDGASAQNPCPGLVLLHDHGARFDIGKEKLVRPVESAPEAVKSSALQWVDKNMDGVFFADRLASEGFVVIVPDVLYWGARNVPQKDVYEGQRAVYDSLLRRNVIWAEQTLNEDAAAARLISRMPYVAKVGCAGWSMGAHRAWLLAAFCKEIESGAAVSWMTLKETQPSEYKASDYSMLIPDLREKYDFPDIARWICPKPFLFLSGTTDRLFPYESTSRAFQRMQDIYKESRHEGKLRTEFFEGGHHLGIPVQDTVSSFLSGTLGTHP
ncbi:MAG: dienelactone hydrolase family protein [Bacteroidales bacterium]|nr:dienelactone hydrolase family protein [Bacteroidales bacterium]